MVGQCQTPTIEEIETIIQSLGQTKAPGPDDLLPLFYQSCWATIKEEVLELIQDFFISGSFEEGGEWCQSYAYSQEKGESNQDDF